MAALSKKVLQVSTSKKYRSPGCAIIVFFTTASRALLRAVRLEILPLAALYFAQNSVPPALSWHIGPTLARHTKSHTALNHPPPAVRQTRSLALLGNNICYPAARALRMPPGLTRGLHTRCLPRPTHQPLRNQHNIHKVKRSENNLPRLQLGVRGWQADAAKDLFAWVFAKKTTFFCCFWVAGY